MAAKKDTKKTTREINKLADEAQTAAQETAARWNEDNPAGMELVKRTDAGRMVVVVRGPAVVLASGDGLPEVVAEVQELGAPDSLPEALPVCELFPRATDEKKTTQLLRVQLTPDEMATAAQQMADAAGELERVKGEAKSTAAEYKAKAEEAAGTMNSRAQKLREGSEMREVPCVLTLDYDIGRAEEIRTDTGACVNGSRPLHEEEQQRGLRLYPDHKASADPQEAPEPKADDKPEAPEPERLTVGAGEVAEDVEAQAVKWIHTTQRATAGMLTRRLGIGSAIAQNILSKLEEAGALIAGPAGEAREIVAEKLAEVAERLGVDLTEEEEPAEG